jgi:hypothetical protein
MTEQTLDARSKVKVLKGGECVIVDNEMTVTRSYMYLYLFLNIGALAGKIGAAFGTQYPFNDTSEASDTLTRYHSRKIRWILALLLDPHFHVHAVPLRHALG